MSSSSCWFDNLCQSNDLILFQNWLALVISRSRLNRRGMQEQHFHVQNWIEHLWDSLILQMCLFLIKMYTFWGDIFGKSANKIHCAGGIGGGECFPKTARLRCDGTAVVKHDRCVWEGERRSQGTWGTVHATISWVAERDQWARDATDGVPKKQTCPRCVRCRAVILFQPKHQLDHPKIWLSSLYQIEQTGVSQVCRIQGSWVQHYQWFCFSRYIA